MAGLLSVIFLVIAWGGVAGTIFAIIGVVRKKFSAWGILMYMVLIPIGSLLFRGVFWVSGHLAQDDTVSTALFWGTAFITGAGAIFKEGPRLLRDLWQRTNGDRYTGVSKA